MSHMYLYLDGQLLHRLTGKYHIFSVLFAQLVQDLFRFRSFHCISYYFTIRICWFSWKKTDIKHWQSWKIAAHFNFQLWTAVLKHLWLNQLGFKHETTNGSCSNFHLMFTHFGSPFPPKMGLFSLCRSQGYENDKDLTRADQMAVVTWKRQLWTHGIWWLGLWWSKASSSANCQVVSGWVFGHVGKWLFFHGTCFLGSLLMQELPHASIWGWW